MMRRDQDNTSATDRRPATLSDLAAADIGVFCWCNRCSHNAVVDVGRLLAALGPALPVPAVAARMRCGRCGGRDVATRPDWPSIGVVARHSRGGPGHDGG